MLEPGGEADLAEEALGAEGGGELGVEDLEGDGAVVLEVLGEEDGGHATAAELALERVAAAKPCLELCPQVGHVRFGWRKGGRLLYDIRRGVLAPRSGLSLGAHLRQLDQCALASDSDQRIPEAYR